MNAEFNRRKFITTSGSLLMLLPLAQYCKSKSKTETKEKKKDKPSVKHTNKKHKPAITAAMVTNRGWYRHKKNGKIHFFDNRGFTPSLEYMKDKQQFDVFVQRLEPWDAKQITLDIYHKDIIKKKKDWITEQAALAFISAGNYAGAGTIIRERIEKRPENLRLWDLLGIVTLRSGDQQLKAAQQELVTKYNSSNIKKLPEYIAKFANPDWETKMNAKEIKWNNQKI